MQTDSHLDSELGVERVSHLCELMTRGLDTHDAGPSCQALLSDNAHEPRLFERRHALHEVSCQRELMLPDGVDPLAVDPLDSRPEPHDAGEVGGACLELVRHERGHGLKVAGASCAAGDQRGHFFGEISREHNAANALGSEQALVAGEAHGVYAARTGIDGQYSGALGSVDGKSDTVRVADLRDLSDRRGRAAHVARVRCQDELRSRGNEALDFAGVQFTFRRA